MLSPQIYNNLESQFAFRQGGAQKTKTVCGIHSPMSYDFMHAVIALSWKQLDANETNDSLQLYVFPFFVFAICSKPLNLL